MFGVLESFPQWVLWAIVERGGVKIKAPMSEDGEIVDAHDPENWMTYDQARRAADRLGVGVGFVFTDDDPFWALDLDKCFVDGQWDERAQAICEQFAGAFIELSQSQTGLHIIFVADSDGHEALRKKSGDGLELYFTKRFFALTGLHAHGDPLKECTPQLKQLLTDYFPDRLAGGKVDGWTDSPREDWRGPEDDDTLIERMLRSKSVRSKLGATASAHELWTMADTLGDYYPDENREFDYSSADSALAFHLAYWTGGNCERMERLFSRSELGQRDKWVEREDYRVRTILNAAAGCERVLQDKQEDTAGKPQAPTGYLNAEEQAELFKGCVYILDMHKVFLPDGSIIKPEAFKAFYGGRFFIMDDSGGKVSRNAWEAYTESQLYVKTTAHGVCFRPDKPTGEIITEEGRDYVNTYVPLTPISTPGDVTPFLTHLRLLMPNEHDQNIILGFMAGVAQNPGKKFQWMPVLQGMEGNGKTILANILSYVVGYRYTHQLDAKDITNTFNAYIQSNLLGVIEEIHTSDRRDVVDTLKVLITNDRLQVTRKGVDQTTTRNYMNFFGLTNYKDAIPITKNTRRYAVIYTAQQKLADLRRDKMSGGYFKNLLSWLDAGGYANITHYLQHYPIPAEYDPSVQERAPQGSMIEDIIGESKGRIEQYVEEAIANGDYGFAGGWVSSRALHTLISDNRDDKALPIKRRKNFLEALGYYPHPILGSTRMHIAQDGGRTILYTKDGHLANSLTAPVSIIDAYVKAQAEANTSPTIDTTVNSA